MQLRIKTNVGYRGIGIEWRVGEGELGEGKLGEGKLSRNDKVSVNYVILVFSVCVFPLPLLFWFNMVYVV